MHRLEIPLIPRMIAERAHAETGIDLHPAATVGKGIFLDHGTGIVVGETCRIGDRVRIYQGGTTARQGGWTIFALETGERLGQVRDHASHGCFFVHDSTLVHVAPAYGRNVDGEWIEEPLRLRGVNLATGSEIWARPLRDPSYRGPYPP